MRFILAVLVLLLTKTSNCIQLTCDTSEEVCSYDIGLDTYAMNFSFHMTNPEIITSIHFKNSVINEFPKLLFERFVNLQTLDAQFCALKRIKPGTFENGRHLIDLKLGHNKLKHLKAENFDGCERLSSLELHRNEIESVQEEAFVGLENLQRLILSSNEIRSLKPDVFRHIKRLEAISLEKNRIESLGQAFQNLPALEILELGFNKLRHLARKTFYNTSTLILIDLSNNRLESVDSEAFETNVNLEAVNLASNRLVHLNLGLFSPQLRIFSAAKNVLESILLRSRLGVEFELETLNVDLKRNIISSFDLIGHHNLVQLKLRENDLKSFSNISKFDSLRSLDVSKNLIESEEWSHLALLKNLRKLNVSETDFQSTKLKLLAQIPNLEILDISNNHLTTFLEILENENLVFPEIRSFFSRGNVDKIEQLNTIGQFMPKLQDLDLSGTQFDGCDFKYLNFTVKGCEENE